MKAAVCYEFGQPLVVEEVRLDAPARGEVKVRVSHVAICHSDVHLIRGEWTRELPVVAGHEAAGVVIEAGERVTAVKEGDRVVVSLLRSCGRCFHCTSGAPQMCEGAFALDRERRLHNAKGEALHQGIRVGGFAEEVVVDASQVVPLSAAMPLDRAALLACGVITGVGAVVNTARVTVGESVVVIGAGGVGLNAIQGAVLAGASLIVAVDLVEAKLDAARAFGATHAFKGDAQDVRAEVKRLTARRGADHVFVTVGSPAAVSQAMTFVRARGTVVLVGMPEWKATMPLRIADLVWNEQRILGSRLGSTRLHVDVPRLEALYLQGRLKLDELISGRYPLERINEAIAEMRTGGVARNVIAMA